MELPQPSAPRVHLPDNSDPWLLQALLAQLEPKRTLVVAISKSGGTVETAAQLLVVRQWLQESLGKEKEKGQILLVTDPEQGALRKLARAEDLKAFEVPHNVGGRFSVLSAVGLLPACLAGVDGDALLDGAQRMAAACRREVLEENPAGLLATLHVLHHRLFGHDIHVLMPYADALRPFSDWYVQLWAESLGKRLDRQGRVVESGPTPLGAVGATDQHAQVQLFIEGPRNKLVTFIRVTDRQQDLTIPYMEGDFAYLGGKTLGQVLDAELRGTAIALARDARPSITIGVERIDPKTIGALFYLYEAATAIAGELYGIDAFNQPGVELGKHLTSGLLGRPGYEEAGRQAERAEQAHAPRYHLV
jgi:glucose-6-phosphate isomerase